MTLAGLAASLLLQAAPPPAAAVPAPTIPGPAASPIDGFCLPVASGAAAGARFYALMQAWRARPGTGAEGAGLKPEDATVPGQLIHLGGAEPPAAFVDLRTGDCSLLWPAAQPPASALDELRSGGLEAAGGARRWRAVRALSAGRPRPAKWLLPMNDTGREGVCAEIRADLRRRDGQPLSLAHLFPCRLAADETVDAPAP